MFWIIGIVVTVLILTCWFVTRKKKNGMYDIVAFCSLFLIIGIAELLDRRDDD